MFFPRGYDTGLVHGLVEWPDGALLPLDERRTVELTLEPGQIATKFDLTIELSPQFKWAQEYIRLHQNWLEKAGIVRVRRKKLHRRLWGFYLRVLDASSEGVGMTEFASTFELDPVRPSEVVTEKIALERLDGAKKMTEPQGYLQILT